MHQRIEGRTGNIDHKQRENRYGAENTAIYEKIRTFGCCCCGSKSGIHMHHVRTRGSIGRVDEENVVPLCFRCHTEIHTLGRTSFFRKYHIIMPECAVFLWSRAKEMLYGKEMDNTEVLACKA